MSDSTHNSRFPRILRCVVDSGYIRAIRTVYSRFAQMHVNLISSHNDQIAMILAKLALNNPAKAFKEYCEKNPWAAEAKMYDV
jgi:hypothetical protein